MSVKLLQITDCHLGAREGDCLLGLNPDLSLQYVLEKMWSEHDSADLLVCSGDLSNEAGVTAYHRLIGQLPREILQAWLPGNHDDNEQMLQVIGGNRLFLPSLTFGKWQVTLLDSSIPGRVPGLLGEAELERAVAVLEEHPDKFHLFFLHHHLVPVGCRWLDTQVVKNGPEVLEIFSRYPNMRLAVCGHVHQDTCQEHGHVSLYSTPSTCIQFKRNSDGFAVSDEMPGYRWIELMDDGSFRTGVSRIAARDLGINLQSSGY